MVVAVREFRKGDEIEDYRVLSEIGRGAASIIYLVQDRKTKQVWALKRVERNTDKDKRYLEQAEMEYRIASEVNHPNIRRIDRMFKKTSGLLTVTELCLVMEFVDGVSLDRSPPRTFEQAVHIFHQVAGALAKMHERGYVHADMKPNNIVVSPGPEAVAKLIDLGQSCKIGTVKQRIQGTPDYMAPEQAHRRPITPKTDIYNLGATMYWVLTRTHVPTVMPKADANSLVQHLDDNLIAKATPAININPRIPIRLNDLIMQCVEIDPARRPASMHEVADRLNLIYAMLQAKNQPMIADDEPTAV